jgi:hypothetical protein
VPLFKVIVPARVEDIPPTIATAATTERSGITPPFLRAFLLELRFGGSENFKISTLYISFARFEWF